MANLDLQGFVTPPQNFEGLYKIGTDLLRNKQLTEQKAERQQTEQDKQDARKTATASYLQSYLDPKHLLTGTNYDPIFTQGLSGILQKGMQLASKGVDTPDITNALASDVADLSKASENVKAIEQQRKDHQELLKGVKGIDLDKYNAAFKQAAFYNPNGSMKDLSVLDPNINYSGQVLKNADVFNNEGINDFVKNSGHTVNDQIYKTRDAKGRVIMAKGDMTYPSFSQPETDVQGAHIGFVPKYKIATEGDATLDHAFKDETGNDVKAPVRMVTDDVWNSLPNSAKGYILQETRKLIKDHPDISIGSTQAEHLGKAIAYDELKNNSKDYSTIKRTDVDLRPLPPKVGVNIYNNSQPPTVDLYGGKGGVQEIVAADKAKGYDFTRFNKLPATAQSILLKTARDLADDKSLDYSDIRVVPDQDGNINMVVHGGKKDYTVPIDPMLLNVPANAAIFKLDANKGKGAALGKINLGTGAKQVGKFDNF